MNHSRIEVEDIRHGEESYSSDLVANIGFELRDVLPEINDDILYVFVGCNPRITASQVAELLRNHASIDSQQAERVIDLMLWYGVLGLVRPNDEVIYIYNVRYDRKLLKALIGKPFSRPSANEATFQINPAFWAGLEIVR